MGGGGGEGLCSNFDVERHRETWSMTEGYHSNPKTSGQRSPVNKCPSLSSRRTREVVRKPFAMVGGN